MTTLRALTIRPPWAWAVIYGGKDVENRSWRTAYRGPLLIHASLRPDPDPEVAARLLWTMADPEAYGRPRAAWQARGAIIGVVFLADIMTDSPSPWALPRRYHWKLEFPLPVDPPFPCPGRPGLWIPPAAVADSVADVL
jgi:ASCH domain